MNGQEESNKTLEGAPESGASSVFDMDDSLDWDDEPGTEESDDAEDAADAEDQDEAEDSADEIEIEGEKVSRETISELLSLQKEAAEDEVLKPWLTGDDSVSLIELARIGASNTTIFEKAASDPEASLALVGEMLAIHFKHHGDDGEELADENAMDVLHSVKHPNTLDPAARPFFEAAKSIAGHARQLSQIGKDLAQELDAANKRIAELEQGPELLKALHAKLPDAEISAAELKRIMDKTGAKSPVVAYKHHLAEQEEQKSAKGVRQAEPKTPKHPKGDSKPTFFDTGDPDENFRRRMAGQVMVER